MYSLDLREKLIKSHSESNLSQSEISGIFNVSRSFLARLLKREKDKGNLLPDTSKCGRKKLINSEHWEYLKSEIEQNNSLTLSELSILLKDKFDLKVSIVTVHNYLKSKNIRYKKKRYMILEKIQRK